jgi:DNA-binding NtrC family response regulator
LVVDLEARSLYEMSKTFRDAGCRTFGASSFADAKRVLAAQLPSVLVADVRLGEFNGIQLLLLARALRPNITGVITNAFADPVLAEETRRLGGTFLVKPIDCRDLLAFVHASSADAHRHRADRRISFTPDFLPARHERPVDRRLSDRREAQAPFPGRDRRQVERRRPS